MQNKEKMIDFIYKNISDKTLKFWCLVELWSSMFPRIIRITDNLFWHQCWCRLWKLSWSAFTKWECKKCKKEFQHSNTWIPIYCEECARKLNKCQYCEKHLKVIWNFVFIWDFLDFWKNIFHFSDHPLLKLPPHDTKRNSCEDVICELWEEKRKPIQDQSEKCIIFVYNVIKSIVWKK